MPLKSPPSSSGMYGARAVRTLLPYVSDAIGEHIRSNTDWGSSSSRGLSTEGYAGGYRDAILDVIAMLAHGHPSDRWGWWRRAAQLRKAKRT